MLLEHAIVVSTLVHVIVTDKLQMIMTMQTASCTGEMIQTMNRAAQEWQRQWSDQQSKHQGTSECVIL